MTRSRAAATAAAALFAAAASSRARAGEPDGGALAGGIGDFGRYEIILDKTPFGAPPRTVGGEAADAESAAAAAAMAAAGAAGGDEAAPVRMASVSRFAGVPAAGFVDAASGRQFLLRQGESCGGYTLTDLDPELGAALVRSGTNEWLVSISWAKGQATDIVPSSRLPYLTAFRPESGAVPEAAAADAGAASSAAGAVAGGAAEGGGGDGARREATPTSAEITPEEEAALVARATVADPDGGSHVSFRELNRLRAKLRREKAEAARAAELAAYEERRAAAEAARAAESARAAEEEEASSAKEKRRRAALIAAIAQGYDVGEDVELTDEEAEELRQAGFQVPGAR